MPNSTMIQFTPSNLMPREPVRFTTIKQLSTDRAPMSTPIKRQQQVHLEQANNNVSESARKKYLLSTDSFSQKRNDRYLPERTSINERDIDQEREALLQNAMKQSFIDMNCTVGDLHKQDSFYDNNM